MAVITFPGGITTALPLSASVVNDHFYDPLNGATSLEEINGHLDHANTDGAISSFYLSEHFQRGTFAGGGQSAATADLNYFGTTFSQHAVALEHTGTGPATLNVSKVYVPVPGACTSFYLPHDVTLLLFTWSVGWICNTLGVTGVTSNDRPCALRFIYDNDTTQSSDIMRRLAPSARSIDVPTAAMVNYDGERQRWWSGHQAFVNESVGWHSAGLYLAMDGRPDVEGFALDDLARVRVRSMRYIYFT